MIEFGTPPNENELEISVFSRGLGECIVLRSPSGHWVVIDSFLNSEGEPVALSYLKTIGVSSDDVVLIVASHWHDDHIKGIVRIAEECSNADFAYSMVLCQDEFKGAISKYRPATTAQWSSGVEELVRMNAFLRQSPGKRRLASARTILFEADNFRVESLSPSTEDITSFLNAIEDWAKDDKVEKVLPKPRRNDTCVALVAQIEDELFLFGADLEVRQPLSGWHAVHELAWNERGRGSFFKIAHHGSVTGHYDPVWDEMLIQAPYSAVTPYGRGKKKLPSQEDIERIFSRTKDCFCAGQTDLFRGRRQNNTVERTLQDASIEVWRIEEKLGQVRFRKRVGYPWECSAFGAAHKIDTSNYDFLHG